MAAHKRVYPLETRYTRLISARVPLELAGRLADHTTYTGQSTTDIVVDALREYLAHHSPIEAGREEARG